MFCCCLRGSHAPVGARQVKASEVRRGCLRTRTWVARVPVCAGRRSTAKAHRSTQAQAQDWPDEPHSFRVKGCDFRQTGTVSARVATAAARAHRFLSLRAVRAQEGRTFTCQLGAQHSPQLAGQLSSPADFGTEAVHFGLAQRYLTHQHEQREANERIKVSLFSWSGHLICLSLTISNVYLFSSLINTHNLHTAHKRSLLFCKHHSCGFPFVAHTQGKKHTPKWRALGWLAGQFRPLARRENHTWISGRNQSDAPT